MEDLVPKKVFKNNKLYLSGLCLITEKYFSSLTPLEMTRLALISGLRWVQYREKTKSRKVLYYEAMLLRNLTKDYGAIFIVNDYVDIALLVDADGVHLGQDDLPIKSARRILGADKIIGLSTHSLKEALRAEEDGADYIGFGPIFHTLTKDAGTPKGTGLLREVTHVVKIPVIAIGGINLKNLPSVLSSGAKGVAVAGAILKGDIRKNTEEFVRII